MPSSRLDINISVRRGEYNRGRALGITTWLKLSTHDFEAHEAMRLKPLQQAIDGGLASGLSGRSMEELIADSEGEAADSPSGDA